MSVPEFRGIFAREIDRYVAQLQRDHTRGKMNGTVPASASNEVALRQLESFKKLALQMMDRILARLVNNTAELGLDLQAGCTSGELWEDTLRRASKEQAASAHEQTLARRRQLEERLRQRHEEEEQLRAELADMQRVHESSVLPACDAELCAARQQATADAIAAASQGMAAGLPLDISDLHRAFDEEFRHLRTNLATANEKLAHIDRKERDLAQLQKQHTVPSVLTLAGLEDTVELDAECRQLQEMLLHGEQALKRMKRHIEES